MCQLHYIRRTPISGCSAEGDNQGTSLYFLLGLWDTWERAALQGTRPGIGHNPPLPPGMAQPALTHNMPLCEPLDLL